MVKSGLVMLLLAIAANGAANAQACDGEANLWQDVHVGMNKADFRALYPTGKIDYIPGCPAYIDGKFKDGSLTKLMFVRAKTIVGCPSKIEAEISSKLGAPNHDERYQPTVFFPALPIFRLKTTVDIWTTNCTLIVLHKPSAGDRSFTIIYQLKSDTTAPMAW